MTNSSRHNTFEGIAAGAAVGTAAVGGDPFAASDAAVVGSAAYAVHGAMGASCSGVGSTGTNVVRYALSNETVVKAVFYPQISALPTADFDMMSIVGANGAVARINSVGKLRLVTAGTFQWTAANTFPTGTPVRVELYTNIGTSTTTGSARLAYYLGDSTTPVDDSGLITGINTGDGSANTYLNARMGKAGSAAFASINYGFDDPYVHTGANALVNTPQPWTAPAATPDNITFVGSTAASTSADGASTLDVTMPGGITVGDLLIAVAAYTTPVNSDVALGTVPAGWSLAGGAVDLSTTSPGVRTNVYTRFVNGTEPATYTFGGSGIQGRLAMGVFAYRGSDGIPSGDFVSALQAASSTTRASAQITIGANVRLLTIISDAVGSSQTLTPADTLRRTVQTPNIGFALGDSNGASGSGTWTKSGTAAVASALGVNLIIGLHAAQSANTAPVVSAGSDQSVRTNSTVTLTGTASDPDGTIASVQWSADASNPTSPTISGATSNSASVTIATAGVYVFRFTAYDNLGASTTSAMTVNVSNAPTTPPTAAASVSDSVFYLIDATNSVPKANGTLAYTISPATSATVVTVGKWAISPSSAQQTFTVTVSESTSGATSQTTVTVPAAGNGGGSNVSSTGVQTVIYRNGAWS